MSPFPEGSVWSDTAIVVVFIIVEPAVPLLTPATIFRFSVAPLARLPMNQIPDPEL